MCIVYVYYIYTRSKYAHILSTMCIYIYILLFIDSFIYSCICLFIHLFIYLYMCISYFVVIYLFIYVQLEYCTRIHCIRI